METDVEALVVGGAAAGLSAALVLGRARVRTVVVDAGEPSNRSAPAIGGLLGQDGTSPAQLYAAGRAQLTELPTVELREGVVTGIEPAGAFRATLAGGETIAAGRVLIAGGMHYDVPAVPGLAALWGDRAFMCPYCHGWEHRDQRIAILGAAGAAHRVALLRSWTSDLVVLADGEPADDVGDVGVDERPVASVAPGLVRFADGGELEVDALQVVAPMTPRDGLMAELGLETTDTPQGTGFAVADRFGATSVPHVFAAGDATGAGNVAAAIATGSLAATGLHRTLVAGHSAEPHGLRAGMRTNGPASPRSAAARAALGSVARLLALRSDEMLDEGSRFAGSADARRDRRGDDDVESSGRKQWVFEFAEGSKDMRELLGGKGANVAEMTRVLGPDRVPAGFTISTEACVAYMRAGGSEPEGLEDEVADALARLEDHAGRRLGDPGDPLLVSVRSGARESMPGMLDTVLNLGLNDESVEGLARATGNDRFAWDSYRRFVQMFGNVSRGVPGERFEEAIREVKAARGVTLDTELEVTALQELTDRFKALYEFPQEPLEQLRLAIRAVFESWNGQRAVTYRRIHRIPDDWGTAVNVQQMVFGNKGETSGSGVAFSRDEVTGASEPSGDFLPNAQGEDVVSGVRTPRDIAEMRDWLPDTHAELMEILRTLERHYEDMQDTEFTVEEGRLYMLQTRNAKRPAQAAVRFAVDAVAEGLLTRDQALLTIDAASLDALLHPTFAPDADFDVLTTGVAASPGAAKGQIVFTAEDAVEWAQRGHRVVLVRPFTEADDVHGFFAAQGILTAEGGKASHAALVARGMGKPCVAGASAMRVDLDRGELRVGDTVLHEGDLIAIDGSTGRVSAEDVPLAPPQVDEHFDTVLGWADEIRRLGVRANADTPEDARRAREFGAEGIGLCRTEHMFMAADRQPAMQAMILASSAEDRRGALGRLLPMQREDFEGLLEEMAGLPVTIRLLDPPLHEFLPNATDLAVEIERARGERPQDVRRLERIFARVRELEETNPMLGTRGARLGIIAPEIYDVQVEAIAEAALAVEARSGRTPRVEIMIPLVAYEQEVQILRDRVEHVIAQLGAKHLEPLIGTMMELPRACFVADRIAQVADFFSFGTNDLTQTALGFSRDDVESGFLSHYLEQRIVDRSPFETIDEPGVGWLVRLAAWVGREARPDLKLGICGEHGGDPDSIAFFHRAGLDYVSCSPFRVPIARVAAAQVAAREAAG